MGVPVVSTRRRPGRRRSAAWRWTAWRCPSDLDADWCERQGFAGKVAQTLVLRSLDAGPDVVLVGLGAADRLTGDQGLESLRRAAAAFVRSAGKGGTAVLVLPPGIERRPGGHGRRRGRGRCARHLPLRGLPECRARRPAWAAWSWSPTRRSTPARWRGVRPGATRVARSVALARDLVNEPPSSLTPQRFADVIADRFAGVDELTVEIWDEERIAAERLGGLLGVAAGSVRPPRLVRVEYRPDDPYEFDGRVPHLALVGKGITFDSGGLSLKPPTGMETMKTDMGGAAAVLAAVDAIAALGGRIPVTAWAPMTENMPSGSATKPGDVLTTRSGKTIEVLNTDAEGRLILSDGLTLAVEAGAGRRHRPGHPHRRGRRRARQGDRRSAGQRRGAARTRCRRPGRRPGEPSWPLPLPEDYAAHIESEVADMKNMGRPGQAGTISAALLLQEFVGDVPWAHLDIAGPSRTDDNRWYNTKGGSGFGVRTLVALATSEEFARWLATRPRAEHRPDDRRAPDARAAVTGHRESARPPGDRVRPVALHYRLAREDRSPRGRVVGHDGGVAGRAPPRHGAVGPEPRGGPVRQRGPREPGLRARVPTRPGAVGDVGPGGGGLRRRLHHHGRADVGLPPGARGRRPVHAARGSRW